METSGVSLVWNLEVVNPGHKVLMFSREIFADLFSHSLQNFRLPRKIAIYSYNQLAIFYFSSKVTTFERTYCAR